MHSALGLFNNDQHCIGWSRGRTPLPFVLVDDLADVIVTALLATSHLRRSYNVVGDVRLSARDYIKELSRSLGRPLQFHPQFPAELWTKEMAKCFIKVLTGRKTTRPSLHDFRSRALVAQFDCGDVKQDLHWVPEASVERFVQKGIQIYATQPM